MRGAVLLFSIAGLLILYAIAAFIQPARIELWELQSHEGDQVIVEGVVKEIREVKGSAIVELSDGNSSITVFVSDYGGGIDRGDRILVKGKVQKYKGDLEVSVDDSRMIRIVERADESMLRVPDVTRNPTRYVGLNVSLVGEVGDVYEKSFYLRDGWYKLKIKGSCPYKTGEKVIVSGALKYDVLDARYYLEMNDIRPWT